MFNVILKKSDFYAMERKGFQLIVENQSMIAIYDSRGELLVEIIFDYLVHEIIVMTLNEAKYCAELNILCKDGNLRLLLKGNDCRACSMTIMAQ